MRLLLDENVPVRLAPLIAGHNCTHVRELKWLGIPDREVAIRCAGVFDAIITLDQSFPGELADLESHPALLVVSPRSHRLPHVVEMLPGIQDALRTIRPGEIVRLFRPPSVLT